MKKPSRISSQWTIGVRVAIGMMWLATSTAGTATAKGTESMGADPVLKNACVMTEAGRFAEARRLLEDRSDNPDAATARQRDNQIEILRRIRLDYSLTEAQMLAKIQRSIPDATATDLARWRDANELQHRVIDGETWYFGREPVNLFRFSEEAKKRREAAQPKAAAPAEKPDFVMAEYLADLIAQAEHADGPELGPVRHRITYTLTLDPKPGRLKTGSRVQMWLPYPQVYRQQRNVKLIRTTPTVTRIAPNWDEATGGELQRTLYFDRTVQDPADTIAAEAVFEYTCSAYYPKLDPEKVQPYDTSSALYREFTAERPPHIVFNDQIRAIVAEETAGVTNPLERARRLFLCLGKHLRYAAEVEYATIPCIGQKGLRAGRGDCGVQAMAFISLCRAAGIPARWQSGWQTKPGEVNMHDWSEIYIEPWGWLPADASHGTDWIRKSDDPRVREFYLGHLDAYRLIVNLDYSSPLVPPKNDFRSEPVDFQRGEVDVDGENLYYDEWKYSFRAEYLPPEMAAD